MAHLHLIAMWLCGCVVRPALRCVSDVDSRVSTSAVWRFGKQRGEQQCKCCCELHGSYGAHTAQAILIILFKK